MAKRKPDFYDRAAAALARSRRPTIVRAELAWLAACNSPDLPSPVEMGGERLRWVGIGWVNEGPARGDETLVLENEDD